MADQPIQHSAQIKELQALLEKFAPENPDPKLLGVFIGRIGAMAIENARLTADLVKASQAMLRRIEDLERNKKN